MRKSKHWSCKLVPKNLFARNKSSRRGKRPSPTGNGECKIMTARKRSFDLSGKCWRRRRLNWHREAL
jgi:hypothetical protein